MEPGYEVLPFYEFSIIQIECYVIIVVNTVKSVDKPDDIKPDAKGEDDKGLGSICPDDLVFYLRDGEEVISVSDLVPGVNLQYGRGSYLVTLSKDCSVTITVLNKKG